jgi:hypothetical protein
VTRVAVLSDTHLPRGSRRLPDACVERLRAADVVLHAGDFTALSVLEQLRTLGPPVRAVHGNVDDAELRALLPPTLVVEVDGCRIGLVHDAGRRDGRHARLAAAFAGCAAIVYGHSHMPEVFRVGSTWMLNPGSPTERRRAPYASMLELRVARGRVEAAELVDVSA